MKFSAAREDEMNLPSIKINVTLHLRFIQAPLLASLIKMN